MNKIFWLAVLFTATLCSCKKDEPGYDPSVKGPLSVEFDNIAGSADLELNTGVYTNSSGENFSLMKLKYYVSNFVLTKNDGSIFIVPQDESYFLIDESAGTDQLAELEVPEGEYKTVSFTLGVDSLRSTMDAAQQTGVLDTALNRDMYWNANEGYVFFNAEGITTAGNSFSYRIGGYGGAGSPTINNLKTVTLDLSERGMPKIKGGKETNIHVMVDVLKMFSGGPAFRIAAHPVIGFEPFSANVAGNLATMFRHDHTEN